MRLLRIVFAHQNYVFFLATGFVVLVLAIILGFSTAPIFLYLLGPLAIVLALVGAIVHGLEPPSDSPP